MKRRGDSHCFHGVELIETIRDKPVIDISRVYRWWPLSAFTFLSVPRRVARLRITKNKGSHHFGFHWWASAFAEGRCSSDDKSSNNIVWHYADALSGCTVWHRRRSWNDELERFKKYLWWVIPAWDAMISSWKYDQLIGFRYFYDATGVALIHDYKPCANAITRISQDEMILTPLAVAHSHDSGIMIGH